MAFAAACVAAASAMAAAAEPDETAPESDAAEQSDSFTLDRLEVPITRPENAPPVEKTQPLPPDGSLVVDRLCRIEHHKESDWFVLKFSDEPGRRHEEPRWALPRRNSTAPSKAIPAAARIRFLVRSNREWAI